MKRQLTEKQIKRRNVIRWIINLILFIANIFAAYALYHEANMYKYIRQ